MIGSIDRAVTDLAQIQPLNNSYYAQCLEIFEANSAAKSINILKEKVSEQLKNLSVHITDNENYETTLQKLTDANIDFTKVSNVNEMIKNKNRHGDIV